MGDDIKKWFERTLSKAAEGLVKKVANEPKHSRFITQKEINLIHKGVVQGLIEIDGNLFSLPSQKKKWYDAFTLNREYFVQFATFVKLITEHGYAVSDCAFEYHLMDICVFDHGKPFIYVETKVSDSSSKKLIEELTNTYGSDVTKFKDQPDRGIDALRKAKCIFRDRPKYFSVINPAREYSFEVSYTSTGFSLKKIAKIPISGWTK
ncbi:MAG: hypothetical protein PHI73_04600 [Patescibacteria group bacterium]|nr:hypothetical protein [Patescibacteria group bacterium]